MSVSSTRGPNLRNCRLCGTPLSPDWELPTELKATGLLACRACAEKILESAQRMESAGASATGEDGEKTVYAVRQSAPADPVGEATKYDPPAARTPVEPPRAPGSVDPEKTDRHEPIPRAVSAAMPAREGSGPRLATVPPVTPEGSARRLPTVAPLRENSAHRLATAPSLREGPAQREGSAPRLSTIRPPDPPSSQVGFPSTAPRYASPSGSPLNAAGNAPSSNAPSSNYVPGLNDATTSTENIARTAPTMVMQALTSGAIRAETVEQVPQSASTVKLPALPPLHTGLARAGVASPDSLAAASGAASDGPRLQLNDRSAPPGYELLSELGRGGVGVVFQARDRRLARIVALKMLLSGALSSEAERERFRREAMAVARLQHPNIVQVFDVGEYNGLPFFSLEFCGGGTLSTRLRTRGAMTPPQAAELMATLADAVHAAHRAGVIHRDIKPGNILFTDDGVPKLSDFGLAKQTAPGEDGPTQTGQVLGTPVYMAPEQCRGARLVGPTADVYSLGVLLYETLTGRTPFVGNSSVQVIWQTLTQEAVAPRQLQPRVPTDLDTICMKCLEKLPEKRYGSAEELRDDLQRFLQGQPISARPLGPIGRAWKWARRRPTVAALSLLSLLAVAALVLGSVLAAVEMRAINRQLEDRAEALEASQKHAQDTAEAASRAKQVAEQAQSDAEDQRKLAQQAALAAEASLANEKRLREESAAARAAAESALAVARANRYLANARLAETASSEGRFQLMAELVNQMRPRPGETDLRGFEWYHLARRLRRPRLVVSPYGQSTGTITTVTISPDQSKVMVVGSVGLVQILDARTGQRLFDLKRDNNVVYGAAWHTSSRYLATCGQEHESVLLRDVQDSATLRRMLAEGSDPLPHGVWASAAAFNKNGTRLATVGANTLLRVWDARTGKSLASWDVLSRIGGGVVWSPNDELIAAAGVDFPAQTVSVRLVDSASGRVRAKLDGHFGAVRSLSFSTDGRLLAAGAVDGVLRIWDVSNPDAPTLAASVPAHVGPLSSLTFVRVGQRDRLFTGGFDGVVRQWDWAAGERQLREGGPVADHHGQVMSLDVSRDGELLITGSSDGTVAYWSTSDTTGAVQSYPSPEPNPQLLLTTAVSPDGQTVACAGCFGGHIELRDTRTGQLRHKLAGHLLATTGLCFLPDGRLVSCGPADATVRIWDVRTGSVLEQIATAGNVGLSLDLLKKGVVRVACSPDGQMMALGTASRGLLVWDLVKNRQHQTDNPRGLSRDPILSLDWSRDGRWVASSSLLGRIWVFDTKLGRTVTELLDNASMPVTALAFSPDSQSLWRAGTEGLLQSWRVSDWTRTRSYGGLGLMLSLAFSADGRVLAAGGVDGRVTLWDVAGGSERGRLHGHTNSVSGLAFASDGRSLFSVSLDRTLRIWRTTTDAEVFAAAQQRASAAPENADALGELLLATWGSYQSGLRANNAVEARKALDVARSVLTGGSAPFVPPELAAAWREVLARTPPNP